MIARCLLRSLILLSFSALSVSGQSIGAPMRIASDGNNKTPVEMPSIKFDIILFKRCEDGMRGAGRPQNGGDSLSFHCQPIPHVFSGVKALGLDLVSAKEITGALILDHIERPPAY